MSESIPLPSPVPQPPGHLPHQYDCAAIQDRERTQSALDLSSNEIALQQRQTECAAANLSGRLRELLERFDQERAALLRRYTLTELTYSILKTLASDSAKCTQIQLSRRMGINRSKMVKLLDDLCVHALVDRDRDLRDRRPNWLSPSQWGRHVYAHASEAIARMEREFAASVPGMLQQFATAEEDPKPRQSIQQQCATTQTIAKDGHNAQNRRQRSPTTREPPRIRTASIPQSRPVFPRTRNTAGRIPPRWSPLIFGGRMRAPGEAERTRKKKRIA